MQIGSPQDIYQRPNSPFVADFVGSSNVLPPDAVARLGGAKKWASLRPEAVRLVASGGHEAKVVASSYLGGATRLSLALGDLTLNALVPSEAAVATPGATVRVAWNADDLHLMEDTA